jgi:hypothetical protein
LEWIHDNLPEWLHREYAITPRKWRFARPDALLIDDYGENIRLWREKGGPAIMVPRPWNDLFGLDPQTHVERNLAAQLQNQPAPLIQL